MLAIAAWLMLLASGVLAIASASQAIRFARSGDEADKPHVSWSWAACSGSVCLALCFAAIAGLISALAGVVLGTVTALITLAVMWEDAHRPLDPSKPEDGTRGLAKAAGDMAVAGIWAAASVLRRERAEEDEDPADELATRRGRKAETEALPIAVPDGAPRLEPVRAPKPRPASDEGTAPPVTTPPTATPPTSGAGAAADVLVGVHVLVTHALSGGQQSVERVTATLTEVADGIGRAIHQLGTRLSEPDQHYGPEVWEKFLAMASYLHGAAMTGGEASSVLRMISAKPLGEFGASGITAPHHDKVNAS